MFRWYQPEIGHQLTRIGEAREIAQLGDQRRRIDQRHAAHRLQCCHDGGQRPVRQHRLDLRRQPIAPRRGGFDRLNVIFAHEVMPRLSELETGQPATVQLGPCRPPVMAGLAQQEPGKLLACPAQAVHRIKPRPHQIAHRLVLGIRYPHRRQLAGPMQLGQAAGIAPVGLDPVARSLRDQRGSDHDALVPWLDSRR